MNHNIILNDPLYFKSFMTAIGFYEADYIKEGVYTNDDHQLYIHDKRDTIKVEDYYECASTVNGEYVHDESKARIITIPMPKTVKEALDSLSLIFNGEWDEESRYEVLEDYDLLSTGTDFIKVLNRLSREKLPDTIKRVKN